MQRRAIQEVSPEEGHLSMALIFVLDAQFECWSSTTPPHNAFLQTLSSVKVVNLGPISSTDVGLRALGLIGLSPKAGT